MRQKSGQSKAAAGKVVKSIRRKTRKHYSAEEKIHIVLAGSARRRKYCLPVPPGGHLREPVLQLVQGIP